jgi:hypothetical protein
VIGFLLCVVCCSHQELEAAQREAQMRKLQAAKYTSSNGTTIDQDVFTHTS